MSKLVVFSVIAAFVGILLAYFMNLPPPPLTNRLQDWKISGDYFTLSNSSGLKVFYKVFKAPPSIPAERPSCSATDDQMVQALVGGCEALLKGEQDPCRRFESALRCTHEAIRAQGHDCGESIIWYLLGLQHNAQYLSDEYGVNPASCAGEPREYDTLLLLHGFPTSSHDWKKVLPTLEGKYKQILLLDFLGHGFSSKPTSDYSVLRQADAAEQLLREQGGEGSALHVLAHDYGDTVAQELLARFNEKSVLGGQFTLTFVALLNGGIFPQTNFPRPGQKLLATPTVGNFAARLTCKPLLARALGEVFGPATQPSGEDFDDFWAAIMYNDGNLAAPGILDYMRERREKEKRWVGALQESNVKVGIIVGTSDIVNPSPGFENHVKKTVPSAELRVLEGAIGHYPQWEAPDATLAAYLDMAAAAA